ncbi:MAG: 2Fe-2S iron-sulfur cluster-binding protein [Rhodospirillales bacterium]
MPKLIVVDQDGNETSYEVKAGQTILDVAYDEDLNLPCECGGSMACATCHVIVDEAWAAKLAPKSEDEEDTLDLCFELDRNSRLGCQIEITDELDGLKVKLVG